MKKIISSLCFVSSFCLAQNNTQRSIIDNAYNIFYLHSGNLDQTLGDLSSYRFLHGLWIRSNYAQQSAKQDSLTSTLQNILLQGGYDYAFRIKGGQNFLGASLEYSHSWINSDFYQGNANTIAFNLYNVLMHRSHFYLETSLKYLFSMQSHSLSHFNSQLILANLELGYKLPLTQIFFLRPIIRVSGGYAPSFLNTQARYPLFLKAGSYMGFNFLGNLKGDIRLGTFFDSDFFFEEGGNTFRENYRLNLALETNLHINKNFRFYLGAQTSFFGQSNIDYAINLGMRFLLGKELKKPTPPPSNQRDFQQVQKEILYQSNQSRKRVQERTYLKKDELQNLYNTQEKRDSPFVQEEIKYSKRQRMIRESSRWRDTRQNEQNYQNRNFSSIKQRDINSIRSYNQREIERKYGQ